MSTHRQLDHYRPAVTALATVAALVSITAPSVRADDFTRGGKWSVALGGQFLMSEEATTEIEGISGSAKLDSIFGGGGAVAYDITDHFCLGVDIWGGGGDIKASALGNERSYSATVFGMDTFLDWNILRSRFTPLLSANLGFLTMSGDVEGLSASETDFLFGIGGGVRWDITDRWYTKAVYRLNWTEFSGFDELTMVHGLSVLVGYRF